MGYRAEKEKTEQKLKRIKYVLLSVVLLLVAALGIFSAFVPAETWKYYFSLPSVTARQEGELRIHFIDVGQGDSAFIEFPDGQTLLIDGGNTSAQSEESLMRYLNALNIQRIDHVLLTHTDADHCGGLDKVLQYKEVGKLYLPSLENVQVNAAYAQTYECAVKQGVSIALGKRGVKISSNEQSYTYSFTIVYPYQLSEAESDVSSVAWLDYHGVSALFTGDASTLEENALAAESGQGLLDIYGVHLDSTEILKVSHHGSRYSTSEEFLQYLNVETAIISCGKENAYGHPHDETIARLQQCGVQIHRTDERGDIVLTIKSDGTYSVE